MTTPGPLTRVVQTCISAPSQWEAWDATGQEYHLRYRHGRGRVEVGNGQSRAEPIAYWDDRGGSHIELEEFLMKAEMSLAPDAVVKPYDQDQDQEPEDSAGGLVRPGPPVPFLQGSFALYTTPAGGAVLAYRAKGSSEDKQLMIPPVILQMAGQASGLSPEAILGRLQSGDLDG